MSSRHGRPVLLIHGAWHASWVWERWLPLFADAGYEPLTIDLRGHGAADGDYRAARLRDYVEDVSRAVERLDQPPILVGHSLGGLLVQHLAARAAYPAAVMVAPVPGRYPARILLRSAVRHPLATLRSVAAGDLAPVVATPSLVRENLFTAATEEETVRDCHARVSGAGAGLFRDMLRAAPPRPLPGTPILLVAGAEDPNFTAALERRHAERIGALYGEIAASGHDVPLDQPWRVAAQIVLAWLQREAPADAVTAS